MKNLIKYLFTILTISSHILFVSCGDDDDDDVPQLPPAPTLSFDAGNSASLERGQSVDISVSFNALSGIASLMVNGTDLQITPGEESGTVTFTYTAADDAAFEDITLTFELTDQDERTVSEVFTVTIVGSTIMITDDITENALWEAENIYMLTGDTEVDDGATLTIEPGTNIYMKFASPDSLYRFTIEPGATLIAEGTASDPIVFSSERALDGTAEAGDWMGLRIKGEDDGVTEDASTADRLSYVRIEYGGHIAEEEAALRLDDVVEGSTFDHIQIYRSVFFGIDVRGGTFDMSHVIISESMDLPIEFDNGETDYTGKIQYFLINSSEGLHADYDLVARDDADVTIANMTMLGASADAVNEDGDDNLDQSAIRLRDDTKSFRVFNSIIAEYAEDGLRLDATQDNIDEFVTDLDGDFVLAYSYIFRIGDDATRDDSDDTQDLPFATDASTWFNTLSPDDTPAEAAGIGVNSFIPDASIPSDFDPSTLDAFFESANFVGAFGSEDWTTGWALNSDGTVR